MQKMSVCSLAEKASVNLKLCRELKLNVKIEMDCRKLKLNRLTRESPKHSRTKWRTSYWKVTTFQFRVHRRILGAKIPQKTNIPLKVYKFWDLKTNLFKSDVPEVLNKIPKEFYAIVLKKDGKISSRQQSCKGYCYLPIPRENSGTCFSLTDIQQRKTIKD